MPVRFCSLGFQIGQGFLQHPWQPILLVVGGYYDAKGLGRRVVKGKKRLPLCAHPVVLSWVRQIIKGFVIT